ncbi:MAG: hypothetical protein R3F59_23955 [Myxococcota bacterium]
MWWWVGVALAGAGDGAGDADADGEAFPARWTNPGFGVGAVVLGERGGLDRVGVQLELRREQAVSRRVQFNAVLAAGVTRPERVAAVASWGWRAGGVVTHSIGDVSRWVDAGEGTGTEGLRTMASLPAYFGLGVSYLIVPAAAVVSPLASIGQGVCGGTFSWHTDVVAPNGFVEAGLGGAVFGHPLGGTMVGYGPLVGAGAQVGRQSVAVRVLVSPRGTNTTWDGRSGFAWTGALTVGL